MDTKLLPNFLALLLIIFVSTACNSASSSTTEEYETPVLSLTLSLDSSVYHSGEPIMASLTIMNIGEEDLVVKKRMIVNHFFAPEPYRDIAFMIFTSSGEDAPYMLRPNTDPPSLEDFITLSPGGVIEGTFELQRFYLIDEMEMGDYSVTAFYINQFDPGDGTIAWKGELESNQVDFTLEP